MMDTPSEYNKQVAVRPKPGAVALPGQFKRPKPVKKVLEEEEFTEAMAKIIRRDFFPEVPKLQAQLAYLEATDSNDLDKLREISERFAANNDTTPAVAATAATPSTFETPLGERMGEKRPEELTGDGEGPSSPKRPKPEEAKSLDAFFSQYHSEDDASFTDIMEKSKQQHRARYAWMYDKDDPSVPALEAPQQKLAITGGKEEGEEGLKHGEIAMWKYTARNSLMYIPDGVEDSLSEKLAKGEQRVIRHANTRLPREFLKQQLVAARGEAQGKGDTRPTAKDKVGVDGKLVIPSESPQVNGYGFLTTPQIHPGIDASPLMTWGTVDSTPMRLDGDVTATPGPVFKIPKVSKRDEIGHRLAENAVKSQRDKKKAALAQASSSLRRSIGNSPSTTSERLQSLSPAARKLINRASPSPRILGGTDKSLRASYTPSHSPSLTPQHTPNHQSKSTPKRKQSGSQTPSLTDNLLNIKSV